MIYFLLSPAKNLNENRDIALDATAQPPLLDQAKLLMAELKKLAPQDLAALMKVSDKIALLNAERNAAWAPPFTADNAKAALYLFNGDVYEGIDAYRRTPEEIAYIERHVRLLSGLYGILRPLDLIQPYRLEMGTPFANARGANLYRFWGTRIADWLNGDMQAAGAATLVNLAPQEYYKAVSGSLKAEIITPVFKDWKNDGYKTISFYAKRARGLMVRYAAERQIQNVEDLKNFDLEGYAYNEAASSAGEWVFLRQAAA